MAGVKIDGLADAISALMAEYAGSVLDDVKEVAGEVAKEAVEELKNTSPEGAGSKKGHYKSGWASKVTTEGANSINVTIYNKKKPGLTHLLEKGHAKRGGGRVQGIEHIAPAEEKAVNEYEKRLKERL